MGHSNSTFSSLRELRKFAGVSTTQLAQRLGVNQSTVVRMEQSEEKGSISLDLLRNAAKALGAELSLNLQFTKQVPKRDNPPSKGKFSKNIFGELHHEEIHFARTLSGSHRLARAFELSDFSRRLSHV